MYIVSSRQVEATQGDTVKKKNRKKENNLKNYLE